jgi:hypothetical protein
MDVLSTLSEEQRAAVDRLRDAASNLNNTLRAAAKLGILVDLDTLHFQEVGVAADAKVVTINISLPKQTIV